MFDFLIFVVYLTVENGLIRIRHLRTPVENMARACWTQLTRMGARSGSRLKQKKLMLFFFVAVLLLIPRSGRGEDGDHVGGDHIDASPLGDHHQSSYPGEMFT